MTEYNFLETKEYINNFFNKFNESGLSLSRFEIDRRLGKDNLEIITFYFPISKDYPIYDIQQKITQNSSTLEAKIRPGISFDLEDPSLKFSVSFYEKPNLAFSYNKFGKISKEELDNLLEIYSNMNGKKELKDPKKILQEYGASIFLPNKDLTWDSIAGYESVKKEIKENLLLPFTNPEIFQGITNKTRKMQESNLPKAVLFHGPPGTCKTVTAKVIAGQVNVPFVYVPLKSFLTMMYGESENNIAGIFEAASLFPQSILFMDEIDAISSDRDSGKSDETSKRILSVILKKIDGIEATGNVLLLGATNRKLAMDPALLSRFDTTVYFPLPTLQERSLIFENYAKQLDKKSLEKLAKLSEDFSGRNIKDVCKYAERTCGARLIKDHLTEGSPNLEEYVNAVSVRRLSDLSE